MRLLLTLILFLFSTSAALIGLIQFSESNELAKVVMCMNFFCSYYWFKEILNYKRAPKS